jgi:hypothetical protein
MAQSGNSLSVRLLGAEETLENYLDRVEELTGHRPNKADVVRSAIEDYCENPPMGPADKGATA